MTTVAAIALNGIVVMGADTCTNVYDRPIVGSAHKVRRHTLAGGQDFLYGVEGDGALPDLLASHLIAVPDAPLPDIDPQTWASEVAHAITDLAIEHHITEDDRLAGNILLGWSGHLWTITHMQAIYHPDGVAAIGTGEGPAIGAIDAFLYQQPNADLRRVITVALDIAINRDRYSQHPTDIKVTPRGGQA